MGKEEKIEGIPKESLDGGGGAISGPLYMEVQDKGQCGEKGRETLDWAEF